MSRSLNNCCFIGNLGRDPDAREMPNGNAVTNFSIAVSDSYKDKDTGQQVDTTEWVNCVAFNRLGEVCAKYLQKGSKVYVSGRFKTRQYEKDGVKHYTTEIVLENLQMLDSRQADGGKSKPVNPFGTNQTPQSRPPQSHSQNKKPAAPSSFDDFDDDIPF